MSAAEIEKTLEVEASSNDDGIVDPEKNAVGDERLENGDVDENTKYLSGLTLGLIVLGLCLAVLLVGLASRQ
jgi:hypothetical protein